jgi:hypothetical protein
MYNIKYSYSTILYHIEMETNTNIKMAALAFLFIVALYVFFVASNLEATFVQDIANNSEVKEEGFNLVNGLKEGFENKPVVEGFEDNGRDAKKVVENIEDMVNQLDDSLHIKKYRKEYEDMITKTDELLDLAKISTVAEQLKKGDIKKNPHLPMHIAYQLCMYAFAKPSLESCLNYIDSK